MYPFAVAALLATPAGVEHTRLHPAAADLYVEVPDVQALVTKLRASPACRFVEDPDVQKLGALTQQVGYDLGALVRGAIPRIATDAPEGSLYAPGDLGDVSISWIGLDRGPRDEAELSKRAGLVIVCDFASEKGADRMTPALREAGWLTDPTPRTGNETGAGPAAAPAVLDYLGTQLVIERHHLSALSVELDSWSARAGTRWILGAGVESVERLAERLNGKSPALPKHDELFASERSFTPSAGVVVARLHADLESIPFVGELDRTGLGSALVSALLPFAGARGEWRIELRGERFVTESAYTRRVPATPFDALYGRQPVSVASARYVPKEAVGAWVMQLQPEKFASVLEALLPAAPTEPRPPSESAARSEAAFARALGTNAAVAMLPITSLPMGGSGSLLPRVLVTIELKDKAAFQTAFAELVARIKEERPKLTIEDRPYRKIPITVFSPPPPEAAPKTPTPDASSPFGALLSTDSAKPCVVVLDDRVLITLSPTHARTEIQRFDKRATEPELHPIAAEGRFPGDAIEASSIDWSGLFGKLYDTVRGLAPMLAQGQALPFDPATLPASSTFTRFFQPSYSWTKRREGGLYTYSESSFGPETPVTLAAVVSGLSRTQGGAAASLLGGGMPGRRGPGAEASAPDRAAPKGPATAEVKAAPVKDEAREKTLASLRAVKTGIAVYRSQTGRVPAALANLLEGTDNFPKGFLDPPEVPKDAWSRELRYAPDPGGAKYRLWSLGLDGIDQQGAGDDVLAP